MSTAPEMLVAGHCGMKTACVAIITNYATGLAQEAHDHNKVVETAKLASANLSDLIINWILKFHDTLYL